MPIALGSSQIGTFRTPVLPDSELPALWGLRSLEKSKTLIDTGNRRLIIPGPGGFRLIVSPGSTIHELEKSMTGHLMLPCTEWQTALRGQSSASSKPSF